MDISQEITLIVVGCAFLLLVAVGIIILILVYQRKQLRLIFEKRELENQYAAELLKTRLEAQEETFNHISRELHDNIGQLLNSGAVLVSAAQRNREDTESLQMARDTLVQAVNEVRSLSKSLDQQWLGQFSLLENLKTEADRLNATRSFSMSIEHPEEISLPPEKQLLLFRMVQEAFQNSLRHGKAERVRIVVAERPGIFTITVNDDGAGFVVNGAKNGLGINNIKTRASLMGGTAQWSSGADGTTVEIVLPLGV